MYLKSLELQGFKSFPDKIKLEFGKGLTAVVGPNGSGKSNIGDAVRWVLGEQSSKTLRGGKMEDVIFSGTQYRKSVGFAAVTLNISNEDHALGFDSDLVSVTRKLYRSGESEYLINGAQVRLKDIVELFMDTGLGKDGYSIIGQGKVADIVSSKSNERREIFEEAAGISKFRYKKAEAERRLATAEDNILRLRDIIGELEARVEPLRIQSEKAQKFIELSGERKTLEVSVWVSRLDELKKNLAEIEDKLLISNGEYEQLTAELEKLDEEIENCYENRQQSLMHVEELRERISEIEREKSKSTADIAVLENDILHINESIASLEQQKNQALLSNEKLIEEINTKQNELSSISALQQENTTAIADCENKFGELSQKSAEFDKSTVGSGSEINELYIKKSELVFAIDNSQKTVEEASGQLAELEISKQNMDIAVEETSAELSELEETMRVFDSQLEEHSNKQNGYAKLWDKKSETLKKATEEFSQTDMKMRELSQRKQLLQDLENNMEGFSHSVKQIVKAGRTGQISGVFGSVAQLISVEPKYSLAIETALGAQMQNIIVESEDTAKRGIRLLKETNSGRATFLPITSVKPYALTEKNLDMQEGYVALASELVRFDERFDSVIRYLLGRIVIAEDIDLATSISKKFGYKFKIVTLDGQVINAGGSFTGGSSSKSTGVLTRKNEIETIANQLETLSLKHSELKKRNEMLSQEVQKLALDVESEKQFVSELSQDKIRCDGELQRVKLVQKQLDDKLAEYETAVELLNSKQRLARELAEKSAKELAICEEKIAVKEKALTEAKSLLEDFKTEREELTTQLSELRLRKVELEKDWQACELYINQLKSTIENTLSDNTKFDEQIENHHIAIEGKNTSIAEIKARVASTNVQVEQINMQIRDEQSKINAFERSANDKRAEQKLKNDAKETASREVTRLTERKETVQRDFDGIVSELWEQYQLSRSEASELAEPIENMLVSTKRLNEIKNKIRALGSVNVSAVEEYKEVSERYGFMSKQLADVEVSKAELERLIDSLTDNMKIIFSESFNKINENFKTIFVELFGGGKAELALTEPDNILESGIEINVAPPGKVIKSLSLLSGGEQSFVAIAIYFAILKIKPSPFCILDEIEAALDDVNVAKYAAYLRNFTDTTQFILVTHRRGTMEEADVLYGVTMQEKGISKLLKLNVGDEIALETNN